MTIQKPSQRNTRRISTPLAAFDVEAFCEVITKRIKDMEYTAKKYSKDARAYRDKSHMAQKEAHEKIAFKNFKEGDLALFLPTRNQATGAMGSFQCRRSALLPSRARLAQASQSRLASCPDPQN